MPIMRCRRAIGVGVVAGTLAACGLSTPSTVGSFSSSTTSRTPALGSTVLPASPRAGSVFSGVKMLGQRDVNSNSDDDPAAYQYRLQYSLDQVEAVEAVDPHDQPGFVRTRVT